MSLDALTFWSYAALAVVLAIVVLFAFVFGPAAIREWKPLFSRVTGWCRRTFTDPQREVVQAEVISYGRPSPEVRERLRIRGLGEIQRSTRENVLYANFEERRRRAAVTAFNEIDLDLDEQAVN